MTADCYEDPYESYYLNNQENEAESAVDKEYDLQMYLRSLKPEKFPTLQPIPGNPSSINGKRNGEELDGSQNRKRTRD
ncbi:hypothetical protein RNJ44_01585 [Nakaseomyces bracarensis]|uniref:Uncharacterized protein n=1 Tax=Nakaseomyces bracarensis TaxID=273131 RepID=A0ABR4NQ18_9SACH